MSVIHKCELRLSDTVAGDNRITLEATRGRTTRVYVELSDAEALYAMHLPAKDARLLASALLDAANALDFAEPGTPAEGIRAVIAAYDSGVFRDKLTAFDAIRKIAEAAK